MVKKEIIIINNSNALFSNHEYVTHVRLAEIKDWVRNGNIIRHIFRYKKSTIYTYRVSVLKKPFLNSVLCKILTVGESKIIDEEANSIEITWWGIIKNVAYIASAYFAGKRQIRQITRDVDELKKSVVKCKSGYSDIGGRPIYLRTDHMFGVHSGGSVGHIAGVLNRLNAHLGSAIFVSTDPIPTVNPVIETKIIAPDKRFLDFNEMSTIVFNNTLWQSVMTFLNEITPSIVYQRYSLNNYTGLKLSRHFNVPFILEYNGSELWISKHWGKPLKYHSISESIESINLSSADIIVVVSQAMKEELILRSVESKKILVNPNGVDTEKYSPSQNGSAIREKYGLTGKYIVGFIGTFGPWHGAEKLVEAANRIFHTKNDLTSHIHFLFIGDGDRRFTCERLVERQFVNNITFTGSVHQTLGPAYLAACDCLVSPHVPNPDGSKFFGSPTKLFEYMAMGKPIIASNLDQIGEVLEHGKTAYMIEPGNIEQISEAILHLYTNRDLAHNLGINARKIVVEKYTWDKHIENILNALKNVTK